ncbi:MAG: acetyl-CoA hydrolase/transferase family protein, partial [Oxalobacter sp.]|nr:acetyl-CoA hydrolase/transferase family protein [Oxalobacter sp.]
MNAQELYRSKKKSLEEALGLIQSGDFIISALGASEPLAILGQLHTIAANGVKGCDITNCLPIGNYEHIVNPQYAESLFVNSWFYGAQMRKAAGQANTSFVPQHLHLAFKKRFYAADGRRIVLLATASPMDEHGYLSLGLGTTYEREAIDAGAYVIVEVNPKMPRTFGDTILHVSEIDALIEVDCAVPTLPEPAFSDKDRIIGNYIAEHVEDGSTIQLGIGGIPNAVADALKGKKHLGIHTEMFTDGMVDLILAGAVDNSMKTLYRHQSIATFAMGTQKLYDFLNNNPSIMLKKGCWTNDPYVVGQNYKMVSINTSIEVDLFGQCASESIGPMQFSGTGGQSDTAVGAQNCPDGKSFIALYST